MDGIDDGILDDDGESLTFSREQIEYLRSEFERQRKWVNLLSNREQTALEELERTQNSVSYKLGRFLTAAPRSMVKLLKSDKKGKIVYFIEEEEEKKQKDLFPSTLLITPELLPDSSELRKAEYLVEEMLISIRRGSISVTQAKDMFSDGSFSMETDEKLEVNGVYLYRLSNMRESSFIKQRLKIYSVIKNINSIDILECHRFHSSVGIHSAVNSAGIQSDSAAFMYVSSSRKEAKGAIQTAYISLG